MKVAGLFVALTVSAAPLTLVIGCESGGGSHSVPFPRSGTGGTMGLAGGGAGGLAGSAGSAGVIAGSSGTSASGGEGGEGGETDDGGAGAFGGGGAGGDGGSGTSGAGMSGAGGSGGGAGASTAGAAGLAGGGVGGSGATSGAGGSAMSGAGGFAGGGVGGGFGGWAGAPGPVAACAEHCNTDGDCRIFSVDQGYRCSAAHRCERFAEPCRSADECLPDASFWIFSCASDADCFFFSDDLCVNVGGVGRCARLAPSANGCDESNPDEITLPRFGVSGSALVCANASRTCVRGACIPGCHSSADCSPEKNGSVCDVASGVCRCVRDEDCGGQGVSHCNAATGLCECGNARDCEEIPNSNACLMGRCGCSALTACNAERRFSGTTYVCE